MGGFLSGVMSSSLSESHPDHYWGGQHRSRASSGEANAMDSWSRDGAGLSPCSSGKMTPGPSARSHELPTGKLLRLSELECVGLWSGEWGGQDHPQVACWCSAQCHAGFTLSKGQPSVLTLLYLPAQILKTSGSPQRLWQTERVLNPWVESHAISKHRRKNRKKYEEIPVEGLKKLAWGPREWKLWLSSMQSSHFSRGRANSHWI